jgi:putative membrane protein
MMGWGAGMFGGVGMLFFWAVIIVVVYLLARGHIGGGSSKSMSQPPRSGSAPLDILQERFAKGEIDKEEYLDRKKTLSD